MTELLPLLTDMAHTTHIDTKDRFWPKQPNQLTRLLNEVSATLAELGYFVDVDRNRLGSLVTLRREKGGDDD